MHDNAHGWRTVSIVCSLTVLRIGFVTVVPSSSLTVSVTRLFSIELCNDTYLFNASFHHIVLFMVDYHVTISMYRHFI
jgi:hypothetical protein